MFEGGYGCLNKDFNLDYTLRWQSTKTFLNNRFMSVYDLQTAACVLLQWDLQETEAGRVEKCVGQLWETPTQQFAVSSHHLSHYRQVEQDSGVITWIYKPLSIKVSVTPSTPQLRDSTNQQLLEWRLIIAEKR